MANREEIERIARQIAEEALRASTLFAPFNSAHEGIAVLDEERDELWDIVKTNPKRYMDVTTTLEQAKERWRAKMREEAVQVGAMALRFILDVCDKSSEAYEPKYMANVRIVVNGKEILLAKGHFAYEDIVRWADKTGTPSVVVRPADRTLAGYTMSPGQNGYLTDGMVFNVAHTDNA